MAETFLFNITETVLSKISSLAIDEIVSAWNLRRELNKLHNTLSTIRAVLLDADEQQTRNHEVKDWLEKLKDIVYDVDDLLDEFSTHVLQRRSQKNHVVRKVSSFFSSLNPMVFSFKIAHKVKEIRNRLDEIAADRKNFHFREHVYVRQEFRDREREQTHSFVVASEIVGRDSDTKSIVDVILANTDDQENVCVLPIVGLGGLGKTTVVKLVYNDERVVETFDSRMWVCLSEEFRLLEKILRSTTGENFSHLDIDQLQSHFRDVLNDKRYLLVLDDVWNEDMNKWMEFRELLTSSRSGRRFNVEKISGNHPQIKKAEVIYFLNQGWLHG